MISDAKSRWLTNRKTYIRRWQADARAADREIGEVPECINPERRLASERDYGFFCKTYFPASFILPWSENHFRAAERIEKAVLDGGLFAFALPRGSGKTTMVDWAALWALLHAHHSFVMLVGATETKAKQRLQSIAVELRTNPLLAEDFPEVTYPIHKLGTSIKQVGYQTCGGVPTAMTWTTEKIVFPSVFDPDSESFFSSSGAVVQVAGITGGEIRGSNHKRQDGTIIRPSLVICDDPQTRDSAKSPTQSEFRSQILAADVAYCAGPGQPVSVVVPCTIIYQDDMADRVTNREFHPEYQGIRMKMLEKFPDDMQKWDKYAEIYRDSLRNDGDMTPATEFYGENREAMDTGALVTWPERKGEHELSAIQHAMNFYYRDEAAFWSECQNEPLEEHGSEDILCRPAEIVQKITGFERYQCPRDTLAVTAFIDVQKECLYYLVGAWQAGFSGQIIDYGVWPDQGKRRTFARAHLRADFDTALPHLQIEQQIYKALGALVATLATYPYAVDGGGEMKIEQILVDANWGQYSNTVYQFCRQNRFGSSVIPSHGKYVGATSQPWSHWKRKKGEKIGTHWRLRPSEEWPIKHVIFDTNWWKTFVHQRLKAEFGGVGALGIYGLGANGKKLDVQHHYDLCEQVGASEFPIKVESKDRVVYEWKERPSHPDNHFLDCLVGAAVGAAMAGIELEGSKSPHRRSKKPAIDFKSAYLQNVVR